MTVVVRGGFPLPGRILRAAALVILALAAPAAAELVDRIVAAVNNDIITLSDLRQAVALNAALGGKANGKRLEMETLEGLVNRRLLMQEAVRLRFAEPVKQEVDAEADRFRQRLGHEDAYRELLRSAGMTERQFIRMLREKLTVEQFVEKKIAVFARVNREEAQDYFAGHAAEFTGKRFPEVQKEITALLSRQKAGQQLDQLLADLRSRADIRMNRIEE